MKARLFRPGKVSRVASLAVLFLIGCVAAQLPYAGFPDKQSLDAKEQYVMQESDGGKLEVMNLAKEDQRYVHDRIAYDRIEEGYYQWGAKLYEMGFRDEYYVRDLAPKAMKHELMNTYDHAIAKGFNDALEADPAKKK